MGIFCKNCNKELAENERPCSACGGMGRNYIMKSAPAKYNVTGSSVTFILQKRREFFEKNYKIFWLTLFSNFIILILTSFVVGPSAGFVVGLFSILISFFVVPPFVIKRIEITKETK